MHTLTQTRTDIYVHNSLNLYIQGQSFNIVDPINPLKNKFKIFDTI